MSSPREFNMNFNFKIVYTGIVYEITISSHATLNNLFGKASEVFADFIDYDKYFVEFVVAGQNKGELAPAIGEHNLDHPIWYEFGEKWKEVSFYVRPVSRESNTFVRMDRYDAQIIEVPEEAHQNNSNFAVEFNLPPPPGLTGQVDV